MSDVQMFWSLCAKCVEFLSQRRSGAVLMESRHEKVRQINRGCIRGKNESQSADSLYSIRAWMGSQ